MTVLTLKKLPISLGKQVHVKTSTTGQIYKLPMKWLSHQCLKEGKNTTKNVKKKRKKEQREDSMEAGSEPALKYRNDSLRGSEKKRHPGYGIHVGQSQKRGRKYLPCQEAEDW